MIVVITIIYVNRDAYGTAVEEATSLPQSVTVFILCVLISSIILPLLTKVFFGLPKSQK